MPNQLVTTTEVLYVMAAEVLVYLSLLAGSRVGVFFTATRDLYMRVCYGELYVTTFGESISTKILQDPPT